MKVAVSRGCLIALTLALLVPALCTGAFAQEEGPQTPTSAQHPLEQQAPPQKTPQPSQAQQPEPGYAISVTVPVVNVDVVVTDNDGNYLNGLKKENFRVLEDGASQAVTNFSTTDAPITVAILVEYSSRGYGWFLYNAASWADVFLHQLKPVDWVALVSFNMRSNIEVDFTHNFREVEQGLVSLIFPPFHESNVFDALVDTVNRLRDVKGKKAVLLLASGVDTFSKLTLDKTLARLKETDVSIYCVGVNQQGNQMGDNLTYLQSQNQLKTFAQMSGGRAWFPRFEGEIPGIMADVAGSLRNQYSLGYTSTNQNNDGKYRKIKVELVAPDGGPLTVLDQKGKKRKFQVYAREGYAAPKNNVSELRLAPNP